jgi:hypothetical protein
LTIAIARAQAAGIGEGGQDHEGNDQRQIGHDPRARDAESADHDLDADELKRDVRHGRDDAGDGHRQRQPAIAEMAAHEITRRDVAVLVADAPHAREHQKQDRIDHDGVWHCKEGNRTRAEGKRRHRNEGVRGIEIAADQKPGDDGAEAPAAEPPFVQQVEITSAPIGCRKAQPGNESEEQHEDGKCNPVYILHGISPSDRFLLPPRSKFNRSR